MFCFIYKWKVSRFLDLAQEFSPNVSRHISRCKSCGDFYHSTQLVAKQLSEDKDEMSQSVADSFSAAIMSAVNRDKKFPFYPARRRFNLPAMAAATVIIVALLGFLWLVNSPEPPQKIESQLSLIASLEKREQAVKKIVEQIESPIQQEARQLKESFQSATSFLISCLDLKISTPQTF